jgi:hypothetical protein
MMATVFLFSVVLIKRERKICVWFSLEKSWLPRPRCATRALTNLHVC